jgi:hypothetical protein
LDKSRGFAPARLARIDELLLVQRLMRSPNDMALNEEFLTFASQAIED